MTASTQGVLKKALIAVPAIVIFGSLIGYWSNSGFSNDWYAPLAKPSFQPPAWMFGVVWTILYTLLGIALAIVLQQPPSKERRDALWLFGGQLLLNFAWSPVFFGMHMIDVAFVIIVTMLVMALAAARYFRRLNPLAGWLMLPYLLWLCLATTLNYETGKLNPGADAAPLGITGVKS
ncbi:tryptophan-rich sensory protein [Sphingomonas sp. RB56-2]|uniref:Tryptophan-rich sensory protein n=1 Tax=Sphingomonas brevis TaxID=2908206 RepID=A0ABT0S7U5_9SPHN|nr:TspO/MBR family protein [Sphingomonas brevis]MCL6740454.1 tryptophan-rich sensory protein [Sphingomonas brevis]